MALFISDKKSGHRESFQIFEIINFRRALYKKLLWQSGSSLALHARGPGFESLGPPWIFLLLSNASKSDKICGLREISCSTSNLTYPLNTLVAISIDFILKTKSNKPKIVKANDSC